jgi:hypothetical protein
MLIRRALIALVLGGAAARAQQLQPLIDRPITLPRDAIDLTLHGTYTNWSLFGGGVGGPSALHGETLALQRRISPGESTWASRTSA